MGVAGSLRAALRLSPPGTGGPRALIASLGFLERVLAPTAVYLFVDARALDAVIVGALLSVVLLARGAAQRTVTPRYEAGLYRRAVSAILGGDTLQPSVLPDEEAHASLFEGIHRIAQVLGETLPNLAANAAAGGVLAIAVAASQPPRVTVIATVALLVGGLGLYLSRGWVERAQNDAWLAWDRVAEGVAHASEGRLDLVAAGRDVEFAERFARTTRAWDQRAVRAARLSGVSGRLPIAWLVVAVGGAVYLDAWQTGAGWSVASARAALLASCAPAFFGFVRCLQELASNEPRLRLVTRVIQSELTRDTGTTRLEGAPHCVEWKDVRFTYSDGGPEALRGVSFAWRSGELLGLTGPNGSGKSTCLRALLGLGTATQGEVLVDGVPVDELDPLQWRRAIAFLPQRPYLPLRQTVRGCLRFVDIDVSEQAMERAVARVGLLPKLRRLSPDPLGVTVDALSIGERQRVALARVLCQQAPLVLLDEPDANLDRDGIELVADLVVELARDRMVLVVAHTPELVRHASRVIQLEDGRVHEETRGEGASEASHDA